MHPLVLKLASKFPKFEYEGFEFSLLLGTSSNLGVSLLVCYWDSWCSQEEHEVPINKQLIIK